MMTAKQHKKSIETKYFLADKHSGRPLMTIEYFVLECVKYNLLTMPEMRTVLDSGVLPQDFMMRILKLIDETRHN